MAVAVLVAAIVGITAYLLLRVPPVDLAVGGRPIVNPDAVLDQATPAFQALVDEDGAELHPQARCYFARPDPTAGSDAPEVACGPVALGMSGSDRFWVVGSASFSSVSGGEGVSGRFDRFRSVDALEAGDLRRPDGARPPEDPALVAPTTGIRTEEGQRIVALDVVLDESDPDFRAGAADGGAAVHDDARCYAGVTGTSTGRRTTDGNLWCGPVAQVDSEPGQRWVRYSLSSHDGPSLVTATASAPSISTLRTGATERLPVGTALLRPDGATPPADADAPPPPDPEPQEPGVVAVLDGTPTGIELEALDGRLVTPSVAIDIDGVGRERKVGTGPDALVAAEGETFVTARLTRRRLEDGPSDMGAGTIVVDGARRSIPGWSSLGERSLIVASVPDSATTVDLEVEFDGRAQTLSLLTGVRGEGAPAALYRRATSGVARTIDVAVPLPAGDPVQTSAVVTEARLAAWRTDQGWAPPGQAHLTLGLEDWAISRPCCDVRDIETETTWRFVLPDGAVVEAASVSDRGAPVPTFVVPEDVTAGRAELVVVARFSHDGRPGEASGEVAVEVVMAE